MQTEFQLTGLSRVNEGNIIASCTIYHNEDSFKAQIVGDAKLKQDLWNYCEGDWKDKKIGMIEHDGFYSDGYTPKNPVLLSIRIATDKDLVR